MKRIIVYYSYEGNTHFIATAIADYFQCPAIRLTLEKEMTATGFSKYVWGGKQVVMKQKPTMLPINVDWTLYDTIIIGSPVWAWTYAPAIRTFFDKVPFTKKNIYFFTTSEGGNKGVDEKAKALVTPLNNWMGYRDFAFVAMNKEARAKDAIDWAQSLSE